MVFKQTQLDWLLVYSLLRIGAGFLASFVVKTRKNNGIVFCFSYFNESKKNGNFKLSVSLCVGGVAV